MTKFSKSSIGFYLELENRMSPVLKTAGKDYHKFIMQIERDNIRGYRAASEGLSKIAKGAKTSLLSKRDAVAAYDNARKAVQKRVRTIAQPLRLVFSTATTAELGKQITRSVAKALGSAKFRLRASMPQTRLKMFDTGQGLRSAYKDLIQPPDYTGRMRIQKFAEGGKVKGNKKGTDSVAAALTPGEFVLSLKMIKGIRKGLLNLSKKGRAGMGKLLKKFKGIEDSAEAIPPHLKQSRDSMGRFVKSAKPLDTISDKLDGIADPVKFIGFKEALKEVQSGFKEMKAEASSTFSQFEGGKTMGFFDAMTDVQQQTGWLRKEFRLFKKDTVDISNNLDIPLANSAISLSDLADAGVRAKQQFKELFPLVAAAAGGSKANSSTVAELVYRMNDGLNIGTNAIANVLKTNIDIANNANTDINALMTSTIEQAKILYAVLEKETDIGKTRILGHMSALTAGLTATWSGEGSALAESMAKVMANDPNAMTAMARMSIDITTLKKDISKGNLTGVMEAFSRAAQSMGEKNLAAWAGTIGYTGSLSTLSKLANDFTSVDEKFREVGNIVEFNSVATDSIEKIVELQRAGNTAFENFQNDTATNVAALNLFGLKGADVMEFLHEFNAVQIVATGYLIKNTAAAVINTGAALKNAAAWVLSGKVRAKVAAGSSGGGMFARIKGVFGKGGAKSSLPSKSEGSATKSTLEGIGKGLKGFGKGLTAFGKAMIGPGGLGLLALTGLLIGVGFAIKLAAPLFTMIGDVVKTAVGGMVEIFKTLADMDAKKMKAIGPALFILGGGLIMLGISTAAYGASLLLAAAGIKVFKAVTGGKGGVGSGVVGVIDDLIGGFLPLRKKSGQLRAVNAVMSMVVSFLSDFAKIAVVLGALSVGTVIGNAVGSIMSFFGVASPMEQLAAHGQSMARTINGLVGGFLGVTVGKTELAAVSGILGDFVGFLSDYSQLQTAVAALPGIGVFRSMGNALRNFFGGKSGIDRVMTEALPMLQKMQGVLQSFAQTQTAAAAIGIATGTTGSNLRQSGMKSLVMPEQINAIVEAVVRRADESPIHRDIQISNSLLGQILAALKENGKAVPAAVPAGLQPRQGMSDFGVSVGDGNI